MAAEERPWFSSRFQRLGNGRAQIRRRFHGANARGVHRFIFMLGSALPSADNRAGMAHAPPRGRGLPGNKADDRLLNVQSDPFGSAFFRVAANFANKDDGVSFGILLEHLNGVQKSGANDRIAADADARGLSNP